VVTLGILFPRLLSNGFLEDKQLHYFVMPKYDIDLEALFVQHKRKFSLQTVLTIGLQLVSGFSNG